MVKPSNARRITFWFLTGIVVFFATELIARFVLGLGDPALSQTHPTIEYMFKPNQRVHPFGNLFMTNRYGMRSSDFPPQKRTPDEIRVMVYGDSVINGGNLTDHSRLATTLLQEKLNRLLRRPVVVGNISAGSWGPPNVLAYINQFGFLDADAAIFVLSSDDFSDAPTFEPLNPQTHPTEAPISAAFEGFDRYLLRQLRGSEFLRNMNGIGNQTEINPRDIDISLSAEREFLRLTHDAGMTPMVLQHWRLSELSRNQPDRGHAEILRVALEGGAPIYDDLIIMKRFRVSGRNPYRDDIHPNESGQAALAEMLFHMLTHEASGKIGRLIGTPTAESPRRANEKVLREHTVLGIR